MLILLENTNMQVKFVYQGYWVMVEVTGAKTKYTKVTRYAHFLGGRLSVNPLKPSGAKWLHLRASRAILV